VLERFGVTDMTIPRSNHGTNRESGWKQYLDEDARKFILAEYR
jgi:hypothetical protein